MYSKGNKFRGILSFLLVVSMLLPNFVNGTSAYDMENKYSVKMEKLDENKKMELQKELFKDSKISNNIKDSTKKEDVRVIVELKGNPLVIQATNEGKKVSELSKSRVNSIEKNLISVQQSVKSNIRNKDISIKYLDNYTTLLNGFSASISSDDIERLENIKGVEKVERVNVYERPKSVTTPQMITSGGLVGAPQTWTTGYKGEGMVIAVLDTGTDPNHKDFIVTDETTVGLTEEKVGNIISSEGLKGKYYNVKVPYAYNYYDKSAVDIRDEKQGDQHGMHVAGTVAANGDTSKGGVKGIAPEAQILAMKVFSSDILFGTTSTDIYIKAIEDAVKLGADAINMSLGADAGFNIENSIEKRALKKAVDNGVICSIAAGNARNTTYGAEQVYKSEMPEGMESLEHNPDRGVVGSPSTVEDVISVASIENDSMMSYSLKCDPELANGSVSILESSEIPFYSLNNPKGYEYVSVQTGSEEDFKNVDVRNKIALVKRGRNFAETIVLAQENGAIGCLVYNHEIGGEDLLGMQGGDLAKIPFAFIANSAGREILEDTNRKLIFPEGKVSLPSNKAGSMSMFSSWGSTPSLQIKPEVTAPGGNIYSTQNNNGYCMMGGTSMASPHSAGGSVLVKDYIRKNSQVFGNLSNSETSELTKVLMMNTAVVKNQPNSNVPYSVRVQGAGLINVDKATTNKITILDNDNSNPSMGKSKIELGVVGDRLTFELKLKNYGDESISLTPKIELIQETVSEGRLKEVFELVNNKIGEDIVLQGKETKFINLSIDASMARDEHYVDGFIKFETGDSQKDLVVPFLGFKGKWDEPRIIDTMDAKYLIDSRRDDFNDTRGKESQFKMSGFRAESNWTDLTFEPENILYNPGSNESFTSLVPYISQLRNARSMKYSILDKDENELRVLGIEQYVRKVNNMQRGIWPVRVPGKGVWDGKVKGQIVKDGRYKYQIESELDYPGMQKQKDVFDIMVDKEAPVVEDRGHLDSKRKIFTARVRDFIPKGLTVDDVSGFKYVMIYDTQNRNEICIINESDRLNVKLLDEATNSYEIDIDLTEYIADQKNKVQLAFADRAGNMCQDIFELEIDNSVGTLLVSSPIPGDVGTSNRKQDLKEGKMSISVDGYLYGWDNLDKITAEGYEVPFTFHKDIELFVDDEMIYKGPVYKFGGIIRKPSGYHTIEIKGFSGKKEISVARSITIDLEQPKFEDIQVGSVANDKVDIDLTISDNLSDLSLFRYDSFVWDSEGEDILVGESVRKTLSDTVNLDIGANRIEYNLRDRVLGTTENVYVFNGSHLDSGISINTDKILDLLKEAEEINPRMKTRDSIERLNESIDITRKLLSEKTDLNQDEIRMAEEDLETAIKGVVKIFVDKSKLQALYDKALALNPDDYTLVSYIELDIAMKQIENVLDDEYADQMTVNFFIGNITWALNRLELKIAPEFKVALQNEIDKTKEIDLKEYTNETTAVLKTILRKAETLVKSAQLTQEQADDMIQQLRDAVSNLIEKPADKTKLQAELEEVKKIDLSIYTKESAERLVEAIKLAEELMDNPKAKDIEIEKVIKELQESKLILVEKPVEDKSLLEKLYMEALGKDLNIYTDETAHQVRSAMVNAKEVIDNENALPIEVLEASTKLSLALSNLKLKDVDKSELNREVENAKNMDLTDYTEESISSLKEVIKAAEEVVKNEYAKEEEVQKAIEMLKDAVKDLELKPSKPEGNDENNGNEGSNIDTGVPIYPIPGLGEEKPSKPVEVDEEKEKEKTVVELKLELEKQYAYLTGYKDGTLRPENEITREELATIITRMLNEDYKKILEKKKMNFKDLSDNRWSNEAINTLYSMGLVEGYKDGSYRPEANITRAEFATIMARLGELELGSEEVKLVDTDKHWAREAIEKVVSNGWVDEIKDEEYRPNDKLLRYEMVTVVNKVLGRGKSYIEKTDKIPEFKDLVDTKSYYEDMIKAVIEK